MRYMQSFPDSGAVQTALNENTLGKPYIAEISGVGIDYDSLSPAVPPTESWVDVKTIDNNTPIYDVAWTNEDWGSEDICYGDRWFCEGSGYTTDNDYWEGGPARKEQHRFNCIYQYFCCSFLPEYDDEDSGYGKSVFDYPITDLPQENVITISGKTCRKLDAESWDGFKPLYLPYSQSAIASYFYDGKIFVKVRQ